MSQQLSHLTDTGLSAVKPGATLDQRSYGSEGGFCCSFWVNRIARMKTNRLRSAERWNLTLLFFHSKKQDDGTQDVDQADDTRCDHVGVFLWGRNKKRKICYLQF